jgi:glycosyltransferase involved in cell wall biosynthesis
MKILFTSHRFHPDLGGIEVNSEILARFFVARGHEVRLVTQTPGNKESAFPFPVIRRPGARELIGLHRWAEVVYQNNIELGTLWPGLFVRRPTVISVRTWIRGNDGRLRWMDHLKKWTLRRVDAVIAISEAIRRESFPGAVVIGNPYRSDLFRVMPEIPRENSVAFLGRFVSDKGVDLLIRAYAEAICQYVGLTPSAGLAEAICQYVGLTPSAGLTLIGAGPEEAALRRLATELGVEVRFTGPLIGEDLVRELNRHEILAVPSLWAEPFGNVALEGMACGCVVVGSNDGGLPDAIGPAGLLFERGNASDLARQFRRLLTDSALRQSLRDQVAGHLEPRREEVVCAEYLRILEAAARR